MEVKEKVREVIVKLLKVKPEELKDDLSLESGIGVDSTEMVETLIALEKAFALKLSPKEITKSSSLNEIAGLIKSKLNADADS